MRCKGENGKETMVIQKDIKMRKCAKRNTGGDEYVRRVRTTETEARDNEQQKGGGVKKEGYQEQSSICSEANRVI